MLPVCGEASKGAGTPEVLVKRSGIGGTKSEGTVEGEKGEGVASDTWECLK